MNATLSSLQAAVSTSEQVPSIKTTHPAGQATAGDSPVLRAAIGLAEQIRAASAEIERGRRLPAGIAAAMKDAGVFGMAMPRAWGGLEVDPLTQFRVIEALAMADGSVGWCAMIGCDGGYMTAFLDQDVGRAMYPDLLMATAAAATTTGQAVRVPGGYIANGCGWAASSTKMALPGSTATAYRRPGSVSCVCQSATSWTRGTPRGCGAQAAMTSSYGTCWSRKRVLSASRIRP